MNFKRSLVIACSSSLLLLGACTRSSSSTTKVGDWVRRGDPDPSSRSEAVVVVLNNNVYVGLGFIGSDATTPRLNDFWVTDASLNAWKRKKDFPGKPRSQAVAFAAAGNIYVGLGFDGTNFLKDFWKYTPSTDTWTQLNDFGTGSGSSPDPRIDAIAFSINDKGYVLTGNNNNTGSYYKDFYQYDPGTDQWTQKQTYAGTKRTAAAVFVISNKAYMVTGQEFGTVDNQMWMYDPSQPEASAWTQKNSITNVSTETFDDSYTSIARYNAVAFTIGGKGYIATGTTGGLTSATWEYDPATDLWTQKTDFERSAREGAIGFSINDRGFVGFGRNGTATSQAFGDLMEFLPSATQDSNNN